MGRFSNFVLIILVLDNKLIKWNMPTLPISLSSCCSNILIFSKQRKTFIQSCLLSLISGKYIRLNRAYKANSFVCFLVVSFTIDSLTSYSMQVMVSVRVGWMIGEVLRGSPWRKHLSNVLLKGAVSAKGFGSSGLVYSGKTSCQLNLKAKSVNRVSTSNILSFFFSSRS